MSKMSKLRLSIILSTITIVLVVLGVVLSGMLPDGAIQEGTKDYLILGGTILSFFMAICSFITGFVFLILSFQGE